MKKRIIPLIITIILVSLLGFFLYKNIHLIEKIKDIKIFYIFMIILTFLGSLYLNGITLKLLARPFNINLKEHFLLSISTNFLNRVTPFKGGCGLRAVYMKKIHKLKYSEFISSLMAYSIINLIFISTVGIIIVIIYFYLFKTFNLLTFLIFFAIFIATLSLILFPIKIQNKGIIKKNINKVLEGWNFIKKEKRLIPNLLIITLANILITAIFIQFAFLGLNENINIIKALYLAILELLTLFINITPGSLGITESLYLLSSKLIKIDPGIALLAALSLRAAKTTTIIIIGPIANSILAKKIKNHTLLKEIQQKKD